MHRVQGPAGQAASRGTTAATSCCCSTPSSVLMPLPTRTFRGTRTVSLGAVGRHAAAHPPGHGGLSSTRASVVLPGAGRGAQDPRGRDDVRAADAAAAAEEPGGAEGGAGAGGAAGGGAAAGGWAGAGTGVAAGCGSREGGRGPGLCAQHGSGSAVHRWASAPLRRAAAPPRPRTHASHILYRTCALHLSRSRSTSGSCSLWTCSRSTAASTPTSPSSARRCAGAALSCWCQLSCCRRRRHRRRGGRRSRRLSAAAPLPLLPPPLSPA